MKLKGVYYFFINMKKLVPTPAYWSLPYKIVSACYVCGGLGSVMTPA